MIKETNQTNKISNEKILEDIELTKREIDAYKKLAEGYKTLSQIPENIESGQANLFFLKSNNYSGLIEKCEEFLEELIGLKKFREIEP